MNNLHTIQEAWLGAGAPQGDETVSLLGNRLVTIDPPEPGFPGYFVQRLDGASRTFATFGDAMDYAASIVS